MSISDELSLSDDDRKELKREVQQVKAAKYVESSVQVAGWNFEQSTDGQGFHFHELLASDREVMVEDYVVWSRYMARGLTFEDQGRIIAEAAADPFPAMPEVAAGLSDETVAAIYKEVEEERFPNFRGRLFDDPEIVAHFPEPAFRERFLRESFDRGAAEEFREIAERPGDLTRNLMTEYYLRAAVPANDDQPAVAGKDISDGLEVASPGDPDFPTPAEQKALYAEMREDYALRRADPLDLARQRAREAAKEPGRDKDGPEIG